MNVTSRDRDMVVDRKVIMEMAQTDEVSLVEFSDVLERLLVNKIGCLTGRTSVKT